MNNLREEATMEDIARTPRICATLKGRKGDHKSTMVKIDGNL